MTNAKEYSPGLFGIAKSRLIERGFKCQDMPRDGIELRKSIFYRRISGVEPVCLTNEKLEFHVTLSIFGIVSLESYRMGSEFEIAGQTPSGEWAKVEIYGIDFKEIPEKLDDIERRLIVAWKAICVARRHHGDGSQIEPQPPANGMKMAGHHWIQLRDYEGRQTDLVVLQWCPGAKRWSHSGNVGTDMYVNTKGATYFCSCPMPESAGS